MKKGSQDLRERTKRFALRIIRLFGALSNTVEAQIIYHSHQKEKRYEIRSNRYERPYTSYLVPHTSYL